MQSVLTKTAVQHRLFLLRGTQETQAPRACVALCGVLWLDTAI